MRFVIGPPPDTSGFDPERTGWQPVRMPTPRLLNMSVQLLPGYTHEKKRGTDSVVGEIAKKDGPTISYDIGFYGQKTLENELWHKEQTLLGKKVKIVYSKQKELLVVVGVGEKVYASCYTKVKSEEELAEVLLIVLSFTEKK